MDIREQQDQANGTNNLTFTLGTGTQVGDELLAIHASSVGAIDNSLSPGGTAASSWTLRDSLDGGTDDSHAKIWTAPVSTAGAQTVTLNETTVTPHYGGVWVFSGGEFDSAASTEADMSSTSAIAPSVTPTTGQADDFLVCLWGTKSGGHINMTPPGGMDAYTERDIIGVCTFRAASERLTTDAAAGTRTATLNFGRHAFGISVLMKSTGPPATASSWAAHFVDVKDFGAVGDYVVATGVGTDNTAAIQAAIDSTAFGQFNEGKAVLLSAGRYKTTAPLVLKQGTELVGTHLLRTMASGNQGVKNASSIEFYGGPTDNAIQAVNISRCAVERFTIIDRRTSPTSGDGVRYEKVVNQTIVRNMDIRGFPTGSSVRVTGQTGVSGTTSDCVTVEDIWALRSQYGINVDSVDNTIFIRDIKMDTASGDPLTAGIRVSVSRGVVLITGVKHENQKTTAPTVYLDFIFNNVLVDGVVSRAGNGGPVVFTGASGGNGLTVRGLLRENSGTLLDVNGNTIIGTRLGFWAGGNDFIGVNGAVIGGTSTAWNRLNLDAEVRVAASGGKAGFYGTPPVTRPVLTYSRSTESVAAAQLRAALTALGLVTDSTTP